ncbi:transporter substrate-binding domain-containing protein [Brevibacillus ruminantium]|uniref:histidine kinase n=1 Tax=Brevibacillus ruminantium TaxID=2950604 RepID=A0ABY4WR05_9BACL|nr:transporter substrate-binding domain-containing protein [Brevibacillus ruminantium]USG67849.1 transporter substrate-binding domain-containing protein [Brevibacillus ruminantium]
MIVVTLFLFTFFPGSAEAEEERLIRVGFDKSLPPLSYLDKNGEAAGFDIDLIRKMATLRGDKIQFIPLEWEDAVIQLRAGQLDLVVGMKYTSTRDIYFDFSDSYLTMSDALIVPSATRDISGINDLRGKVVAVQRDDAGIYQLESIRGGKMLIAFNQPDAMDMLFLGRADVFLGNRWTAEYVLQKANMRQDYRIRTGLIPPSDYAFAVREGNYELLNKLNEGLKELHRSGTYELLYSQYLEPYNAMAIDWWRKLVYGLLIVMGLVVIVLAGSFLWNKRLQREVRVQTAALADSFAFQRKVLDSVDNGILSFDQTGRITLINHAASRLLGLESKPAESYVMDCLPHLPVQQALMGEKSILEGELHLGDGTGRIVYYYIATLSNSVGAQVGGILCLQDRTEQKHLQARLIAQEKMRALGELVAGIAHEIRNPLTAIKTFTELLPKKLDDTRFRAELLEHVPEEVARMNRIIEDLLDYSREKPVQQKWEKPLDLVQSVMGLFTKRMESEGIRIVVDISPDLKVFVDRDRIKQVLINLILNAIEAMADSQDKQLTIHTKQGGKMVCLAISDTGSGIAQEDLLQMFQPFYTTKSQGIGLGLYISQKIMHEHGGEIEVKSEVWKGTTFLLQFAKGENAIEHFDH